MDDVDQIQPFVFLQVHYSDDHGDRNNFCMDRLKGGLLFSISIFDSIFLEVTFAAGSKVEPSELMHWLNNTSGILLFLNWPEGF